MTEGPQATQPCVLASASAALALVILLAVTFTAAGIGSIATAPNIPTWYAGLRSRNGDGTGSRNGGSRNGDAASFPVPQLAAFPFRLHVGSTPSRHLHVVRSENSRPFRNAGFEAAGPQGEADAAEDALRLAGLNRLPRGKTAAGKRRFSVRFQRVEPQCRCRSAAGATTFTSQ